MLLRRRDVLEESTKDVQQRVLMVLCDRIEKNRLPENVRGFLVGTMRREIANHKRAWRPEIEQGVDADAATCAAPDPEGAAELAERWEKLLRYLTRLPRAEAEVFERVDLDGQTLDEVATELRRPRSTVADQLVRARDKLEELVRVSARATELGERRRPPAR
jgi:RNA polymerase sigma factor (sigma-70 family)